MKYRTTCGGDRLATRIKIKLCLHMGFVRVTCPNMFLLSPTHFNLFIPVTPTNWSALEWVGALRRDKPIIVASVFVASISPPRVVCCKYAVSSAVWHHHSLRKSDFKIMWLVSNVNCWLQRGNIFRPSITQRPLDTGLDHYFDPSCRFWGEGGDFFRDIRRLNSTTISCCCAKRHRRACNEWIVNMFVILKDLAQFHYTGSRTPRIWLMSTSIAILAQQVAIGERI